MKNLKELEAMRKKIPAHESQISRKELEAMRKQITDQEAEIDRLKSTIVKLEELNIDAFQRLHESEGNVRKYQEMLSWYMRPQGVTPC